MIFDLEQAEAQFILQVLGEMPSKSGCFPLIVKIQQQAQAQMPKQPEEEKAA